MDECMYLTAKYNVIYSFVITLIIARLIMDDSRPLEEAQPPCEKAFLY